MRVMWRRARRWLSRYEPKKHDVDLRLFFRWKPSFLFCVAVKTTHRQVLDKEKIQKQNMGAQIKKEISIMKMIRHRCVHIRLSDVAPCRVRPSLYQEGDFHL